MPPSRFGLAGEETGQLLSYCGVLAFAQCSTLYTVSRRSAVCFAGSHCNALNELFTSEHQVQHDALGTFETIFAMQDIKYCAATVDSKSLMDITSSLLLPSSRAFASAKSYSTEVSYNFVQNHSASMCVCSSEHYRQHLFTDAPLHKTAGIVQPLSLVDAHNPLILNLSVDLAMGQAIDVRRDLPAEATDRSKELVCTYCHICEMYLGRSTQVFWMRQHLPRPA